MSSRRGPEIFRKKALEKLSSPEQLDQLTQIVNRQSWIPLLTIAGLILVALIWSLVGRVPITVQGNGLLVYPRQVVSLQVPASGEIVALDVTVGDYVRRGQVMGTINQPVLEQALRQEGDRLQELQRRNLQVVPLRDQRADLERGSIQRERQLLSQRIGITRSAAESIKQRSDLYLVEQRLSLEQLLRAKQSMDKTLRERYEGYQQLREKGLVSDEAVLQPRQAYEDNQQQTAELQLRTHELDLSSLEAEERYQERADLVAGLEADLRALNIRAAEIDQQQLETDSSTELEMQEVRGAIERYEEELETKSQIVSEYNGRLLEVTAAAGQIVSLGQRFGSMETEDPQGRLAMAAYFEVSTGKQVQPGMQVRIAPDTVERERFGSMMATVTSVSPFPVTTDAITNVVGNAEVAQMLAAGGIKIEVFCELLLDADTPTGYGWTSGQGPEDPITAGTTAQVRATVESRRPISLIIPILRRWSGT